MMKLPYTNSNDCAMLEPNSWVKRDSKGAIVGTVGGSYGGGIQANLAESDNRIRAINPYRTWDNLQFSLDPNNYVAAGDPTGFSHTLNKQGVFKRVWTSLFFASGQQEPVKLLLNQRDPGQTGRVLVYYQYFGRARASQIAAIDAHLADLARLDAELAAEEERLAALEARQKGELTRLTDARERRGRALVSLDTESKNRAKELERLREQQGGLEKLVRELRRALERAPKFPTDSKDAFAKLRGRLTWPVAGRLAASYGQTRAGGVKWDGMLLTGVQGSPVRAVYHGRVVYADWLSGLGLLIIVDHGDGYLSLYGHNERLYKDVGERVTAGDTIATLGDSGGRPRPELYFEIRKGGRPVDPRPWFKTPQP